MKTAYAYIRVSTNMQEELSLDAQLRLIKDYALANDIVISKSFIESGISGRNAEKRPQFMQMISEAKEPKADVDIILVWKFSRFARNQEESIVYKSLLKKQHNIDVISISEPLIDGPFGSLIERIIEWMDEYYSIRLSGEVIRGMTEKALRGGYNSAPPLGYKIEKGASVPDLVESEANIIRMIFSLCLSGRGNYEIAKEINALGYKTKRGGKFEARTIAYILCNPFYIGKVRWNYFNKKNGTLKESDEVIIQDGLHSPIIDAADYEKVQRLLTARKTIARRRPSGTYKHWLSGVCRCYKCGAVMTYNKNGKWEYVRCSNVPHFKCDNSKNINLAHLQESVIEAIKELLSDELRSFALVDQDKSDTLQLKQLEDALRKINIKEERIKESYREGIDTIEDYKSHKKIIDNERNQITEKIKNIKDQNRVMITERDLKKIVHSVYELLTAEDTTVEIKNNALRSIVERIEYDIEQNQLKLIYRYAP